MASLKMPPIPTITVESRETLPILSATMESRKTSPLPTATSASLGTLTMPSNTTPSSKTSPLPSPNTDFPAGPLNMNLFLDEPRSPALLRDLSLTPNAGVRGGPYALVWMERPPIKIPIRYPSPEKK
ncbi:hypothetical protein F4776DRAFT_660192 [Hypoxylon sp. NC0597]|nr:hypothetical protein F4776DRAFT_660192 [Hypoxylon sp. NC0597]